MTTQKSCQTPSTLACSLSNGCHSYTNRHNKACHFLQDFDLLSLEELTSREQIAARKRPCKGERLVLPFAVDFPLEELVNEPSLCRLNFTVV
jgi:hypothetical protein